MTIVRPSHTYDRTSLPMDGGYTVVDRMLQGKKVIVHGDGTSLWTYTHHADFAKGFVGLLGNTRAIGEAVHITNDEWLTWNQLFQMVASAFGTRANIVHIPSDLIAAHDQRWGDGLLGDKAHCLVFDNSKIKRLVPDFGCTISYSQGVREVRDWYNADAARRVVNPAFNATCDKIIASYQSIWPGRE